MEDDKYGLLIFHAENLDGVIELDSGIPSYNTAYNVQLLYARMWSGM